MGINPKLMRDGKKIRANNQYKLNFGMCVTICVFAVCYLKFADETSPYVNNSINEIPPYANDSIMHNKIAERVELIGKRTEKIVNKGSWIGYIVEYDRFGNDESTEYGIVVDGGFNEYRNEHYIYWYIAEVNSGLGCRMDVGRFSDAPVDKYGKIVIKIKMADTYCDVNPGNCKYHNMLPDPYRSSCISIIGLCDKFNFTKFTSRDGFIMKVVSE